MELIRVFKGHSDRVWSFDIFRDELLVSCSSDRSIKIWTVKDGVCQTTLDGTHSRTIRQVAWCPKVNDLLCFGSASFDATAVIWRQDGGDFEPISPLEGHENEVKSIAFNFDATMIATCSRDKTIWIWERDEDDDFSCQGVLSGHSQDVKYVKWHPTENVLFSCSYDDSIKIWKLESSIDDWICTNTLKGHKSTVWQIDFSPCLKFLVSCSQDKALIVWSLETHQIVSKLDNAHDRAIYSVSWAGSTIASAGADNFVKLYRFDTTLHNYFTMEAHDNDINCVKLTEDKLITCSDDKTIKLWQLN